MDPDQVGEISRPALISTSSCLAAVPARRWSGLAALEALNTGCFLWSATPSFQAQWPNVTGSRWFFVQANIFTQVLTTFTGTMSYVVPPKKKLFFKEIGLRKLGKCKYAKG